MHDGGRSVHLRASPERALSAVCDVEEAVGVVLLSVDLAHAGTANRCHQVIANHADASGAPSIVQQIYAENNIT